MRGEGEGAGDKGELDGERRKEKKATGFLKLFDTERKQKQRESCGERGIVFLSV